MSDWMEELERLGGLRDKGLLTEEQFEAERNKLLPSTDEPFSKEEETTKTSPQTNTGQPPPPDSSNQPFRDRHDGKEILKSAKWNLSGLSGFLTASLILLVIMHVARIVAHARRWSVVNDMLNGEYVSIGSADAADNNVLNYSRGLIYVSAIFLILMIIWAWKATNNLEHWNKNPKWGKGWAIGGWFTPIGMFFIPYQVVRDAWRLAPSKDSSLQTKRNNWWLASFISWWIGLIMFRYGFADLESLEAIKNADIIAIVGISIQIFSALTMIKAIRQISDRHAKATLT